MQRHLNRIAGLFVAVGFGCACIAFSQGLGGPSQKPPGPPDAFEQFMPSDLESRRMLFDGMAQERKLNIARASQLVRTLSKEDLATIARLVSTLRYLGEIRADEAVPLMMDYIDARQPFAGSTQAPMDATVIKALAKIGKTASTTAIAYLAKDQSSTRVPKYLRVVYLVEGSDVGKFMLQQAADKEKDPEKKDRLTKALELFANADKVVP